jgi:hypothetical protein
LLVDRLSDGLRNSGGEADVIAWLETQPFTVAKALDDAAPVGAAMAVSGEPDVTPRPDGSEESPWLSDYPSSLERNTRDGVHIASLAGTWIALVGGLGGMRDHEGRLSFAPRFPSRLDRLEFSPWRGRRLRVTISRSQATYSIRDALLPGVQDLRACAAVVAEAVVRAAVTDQVASDNPTDLTQAIRGAMWQPAYPDAG